VCGCNFGFSRYAERLGRSANSFDELYEALQKNQRTLTILLSIRKIEDIQPTLFLISVPFPGNLYSAFRSAQWVKSIIKYQDFDGWRLYQRSF
jgi:hypothetical protein